MSRFLSEKLQDLQAYTPGEQPEAGKYIKLNTNENPYPPSDEVGEIARKSSDSLHLYCDNATKSLTETFSAYKNIEAENVIFGNGSDEILAFCFLAFCSEKIPVCFPEISYGFYEVFAQLFSVPYEKIPLKEDLSIHHQDYFSKGKTILIANPNAPTSLFLSLEKIQEILEKNPDNVVIIDEAYVDFGGESACSLTKKFDNLLVTGTFSKSRNLAGARLGYAIGNQALIADLNRVKYSFNPYNINTITQALGCASIKNEAYFQDCTQKIIKTRDFFKDGLENLGCKVLDSKANFVFAKHEKYTGKNLLEDLKQRGILVRHFSHENIKDYVRITIGTQENMEYVLKNLKEMLEEQP